MKPTEIRNRFDVMYSEQTNVQSTWETISQYIVPFRGGFWRENTNENAIDWHEGRDIYDSTAPMANNLLASSIHSALTNPAYQWFNIRFRGKDKQKSPTLAQWCSEAAMVTYNALNDSNFDLECNEVYLDLPSYGTGFVIEESRENPDGTFKELDFQSVPLKEGLFEEDASGQAYRFYREYRWTANQIVDRFGWDKVPQKVRDLAQSSQGAAQKLRVILAIYPRKDKMKNLDSYKMLPPKERPYGCKWILRDSAEQIGDETGYYEMPVFVPRWRKTNQSKYGHSPGMIALPDILTLNRLVELILKSTEKVVDPANLVTERGLLSNLDLQPAGLTVVRDIERSLRPYESGARFDVSNLQRERLQMSINSIFYVDQLQLKESPAMTATEVNVRYELMQRLLGPTFGRLKSDFLDPLVERTFKILYRAGQIPEIPEEAYGEGTSPELDIIYTGPMARAQRMDKVNAAFQWAGQLAEVAAMHPRLEPVLDRINVDEFAKITAVESSVNPDMVNTDRDVQQMREAEAEQAQMAQAAQAGEAMKSVSEGAMAAQEAANVTNIGQAS